ncbi:MAG: serine/threonine protein kinase [Gemmataceae bacterium]|nr:serine/threonine protein kinase [Gemmataceae bacterium]
MKRSGLRAMRLMLVCSLIVCVAGASLSAQEKTTDWRQFRGPGGQGVSPTKGLPLTWNQQENVLWKTALPGAGSSSPIIVGARVFITCYSGFNVPGKGPGNMEQLKLHVVCLNRDSGKILWNQEVAPTLPEQAKVRDNHGYASSTPTSDGERVYAFFGKSGVLAFDFEGKQLWRSGMGSGVSGFGTGASPILFNDLLIVNASVESESLVALDTRTGKEKWRSKGIREAFNTPALVPVNDGKTELVVGMPGKVLGFDPATGEQSWSCANEITWYIVPSVVAYQGVVWSIGGRSGIAAVAVRAGGRGDVTKTHRLWTSKKGCNVSSPIIHEGRLYWMNDQGIAYCAEAKSGNIIYEERVDRIDQVWASPVLADGKLFYLSRRGDTIVLPARPKHERLVVNTLRDGSTFNASPAVAGDRLFLRSDLFLYCVGGK